MKKLIILIGILFLFSATSEGQRRTWDVTLSNGAFLSDVTLEGLQGDSLVLLQKGDIIRYPVSLILKLSSVTSQADIIKNTITGTLLGAGVGFMTGQIINAKEKGDKSDKVYLTPIGAGLGGLIGYGTGRLSQGEKECNLFGLELHERLATIEYLLLEEGIPRQPQPHLLTLRNGSVIKGTILENIPDSIVRIRTLDGSIFVYQSAEVSSIQNNNDMMSPVPKVPVVEGKTTKREFVIGLSSGISSPAGDFAKTSSGAAVMGFTVNGTLLHRAIEQDASKFETDWLTSVAVSFNEFDESALPSPQGVSKEVGSWLTVWPLTGILLGANLQRDIQMFATVQCGLVIGSSPSFKAWSNAGTATQESFTAVAVAYKLGVGATLSRRYFFQAEYMAGEPEYRAAYYIKQPTAMYNITAGIFF